MFEDLFKHLAMQEMLICYVLQKWINIQFKHCNISVEKEKTWQIEILEVNV